MKKTTIPTAPTLDQKMLVNNCFNMDEAWFGNIFKKAASFVESPIIYGEGEGSGKDRIFEWHRAQVYAQNSFIYAGTDKQESAIYCFFVYFENGVYHARSIEMVSELIEALKVDHAWREYQSKVWRAKYDENRRRF